MKVTIMALVLYLCSLTALAQQSPPYSVKGAAIDSVVNAKLTNASISVLNAKDSTLAKFTRAKADGTFSITGLKKGKFILLMTYPGYADYVEQFSLDSVKTTHNFGRVTMDLKSRLLKEVIVKGTVAAIKIKGDTTEFNAKAFKIEPNSKVEDLLRQLPGIQVDKDGKITAQGQSVPKVLVDGEEFFGDDPTLVTKNIRADMVDKVQLYDKKSDQATFTGIDDGQKTKTINIKLKEDKKNGYFGKVNGGAGTDGYYETQALFNMFRGKKKFSVYGTISNTGKTGLGWEDNNRLGTQEGMTFGDNGDIYITGSGDDLDSFDGQYRNSGLPIARTGGVHYDAKWNGDKESINANYKIGSLTVDQVQSSLSRNTLSDSLVIGNNSSQTSHNYMFRQKADATYNIKLDTTSNLKLSVDGTIKNSQTSTTDKSSSFRNDTLINDQNRRLNNELDGKIFNATAFYTKKLKKPGRTLSVNVTGGINDSKANGNLYSQINYYNKNGSGAVDSAKLIDQYKTNDLRSSKFLTNITYTEPLAKGLSLVFNYGISINNSDADRKSFSQSAPGRYDVLIDSLSSDYKFNQLSNQVGAIFNLKKGKHNLNFGTRVADLRFKQVATFMQNGGVADNILERHFTNWNPQLSYQWRFSSQGSFRFNYNGNQRQPSIDQIQPVRINNDPLNITIGNPNLKPSFNHQFNIGFNNYKVLTEQYISLYSGFTFNQNPIVNNITTSTTTGKNTIEYENLPGKSPLNYYGGLYLGRKLGFWGINIGGNFGFNGQEFYSFKTDDVTGKRLNRTTSNSFNGQLEISKYVQKKYSFSLAAGPEFTRGQSSLSPNINNNRYGFTGNGRASVNLPFKILIATDGNYTYTGAAQSFGTDFRQFIWNASIAKSFFKSENLKFIVSGNDLLNQNSGFNINSNGTNYSETRTNNIRRYFLFTVSWDFNKMGGGAPAKK
ncbi:TonB-dependent receptor [Mucilaginibacter achroorhodeus]|uniref:TonB-dependent receptor n=1 Tax=Mucilaginibacter achroorhodeus TaxID=2599294 RepID=A0A563TYV1_9SPHI|nr:MULTISPECIES: outer membrane beta-barrel family protein [Mucilaginibacter]QXV65477.1 TonB-dependent receptor family protein [Mucilaginibacter sp. 21P]TWR23771.1 TonB-dependent receptor [Mucilaginibacter achroorhodeus]